MNGDLFIDANPSLFEHILVFLRRSNPPIFWTRTNGFGYALHEALRQEAEYFGVIALRNWIAEQRYLDCIAMSHSIEQVDPSQCIKGLSGDTDNVEKVFDPANYKSKYGGV